MATEGRHLKLPSFLTGSGNASCAKHFKIRLDQSILTLRGSSTEASSVHLTGKVVLCLSEPMRVQRINLRFVGEAMVDYPSSARPSSLYMPDRRTIVQKEWSFISSPQTLPADNYEWPFSYIITGDMPESIEGLPHSWIIYRLKASIERSILLRAITDRAPVRIVRTFDPSALELAHAMSVENVWPDKLNYSLSTPTKAHVFGTDIPVNFSLVPLLKGLAFGKIVSELIESMVVVNYQHREYYSERVVGEDAWELPEGAEMEDVNGQEGYTFTRLVSIPKNLKQCVQSVDEMGIKVRHKLKFVIQLLNPDGHISELRATLPICIFISPNLPLNENNELVNQLPQTIHGSEDFSHHAPPLYGEHVLDQIYSGVETSGYNTPAHREGSATPFTSRSRTGSIENLASMNGLTSSNLSASMLESRLSSMQNPSSNRWTRERVHDAADTTLAYGSHETTPGAELHHRDMLARNENFMTSGGTRSRQSPSNPLSRRVSEEQYATPGTHSPQHVELSSEELSKVPSYGTALQTPLRSSNTENLPTYETATSRPPSPAPPVPQISRDAHTAIPASLGNNIDSTVVLNGSARMREGSEGSHHELPRVRPLPPRGRH